MIVHHIARFENLPAILSGGLKPSMTSPYDHVGAGIYVYFDDRETSNMMEYLGIYPAGCIAVEVDKDSLLMDEDSLMVDVEGGFSSSPIAVNARDRERLKKVLPSEAFDIYVRYAEENGDTQAIDDPLVGKFKTDLIDKFKIRPSPLFMTSWGHYSVLTARCVAGSLDPVDIKIFYEDEFHDISKLDIVKLAMDMNETDIENIDVNQY